MHYINELIADGKTYFPPFEGSDGRPRTKSSGDKKHKDLENTEEEDISGISFRKNYWLIRFDDNSIWFDGVIY